MKKTTVHTKPLAYQKPIVHKMFTLYPNKWMKSLEAQNDHFHNCGPVVRLLNDVYQMMLATKRRPLFGACAPKCSSKK